MQTWQNWALPDCFGGQDRMLTYANPLYLDTIDRRGAGHSPQRVTKGVAKRLQ